MEDFALHTMLAEIWRVVADANRYFAGEEPWVKRKTDPERMATILYVTAEVLRSVAIMAQPVIPGAAGKLLDLRRRRRPTRASFAHAGRGRFASPAGWPCPLPSPSFRAMWRRRSGERSQRTT